MLSITSVSASEIAYQFKNPQFSREILRKNQINVDKKSAIEAKIADSKNSKMKSN